MVRNELWLLITQSDVVSKAVLLLLLVCSIMCWAIFLYKIVLFRIKKNDIFAMERRLKSLETPSQIHAFISEYAHTYAGYLVISIVGIYKKYDRVPQGRSLYELVQYDTENIIDEMIIQDEQHVSFITMSAAISPLLGLFGTVWGLVHAFIDMSHARVADISTVAPGVAEALITTLAGLLVAIPALVMSNYIAARLRETERFLYLLADKMHTIYATHLPYKEGLCTNVNTGAGHELAR